jgi:hypothetical protein
MFLLGEKRESFRQDQCGKVGKAYRQENHISENLMELIQLKMRAVDATWCEIIEKMRQH